MARLLRGLCAAALVLTCLMTSVSATAAGAGATAAQASETRCFPDNFLFGTATAAFQVEGGWNASGREPSIWDDYCRAQPDLQCADVADDFFHRYEADVARMAGMGLSSFRFSISWSRVMHWDPVMRRMAPTPAGLSFYHALLDALRARGITPVVTLYHFDLPASLQMQLEPHGWLHPEIVDHFEDFASLAFREFGTKVRYWATFNEPLTFISGGYGSCDAAPGGLQPSETHTYTVAHHVLLAHARAVALFREFQVQHHSDADAVVDAQARIGIVLNAEFGYPLDPTCVLDVMAAERKMQFDLGWFLEPLVSGDYPAIMRKRVGDRLPRFTPDETALVKGSYDLFMLNHYYSRLVTDCDSGSSVLSCSELPLGHAQDRGLDDVRAPSGARVPPANSPVCSWLAGYPQGYLDTIKWLHKHDTSAEILLTENGWCGDDEVENMDQLWYFQAYLEQVYKAVTEEKIPVIGYTAWSFLDNNEWGSYAPRFGLYYVNYTTADLPRVPRPTANWFTHVATTKCLDGWEADKTPSDDAFLSLEKLKTLEDTSTRGENEDEVDGVPWTLGEVLVLAVLSVVLLVIIAWQTLHVLNKSSQGRPEELQVLISLE